ncbi:MAG: putative toxin-antitoxin system toxin component, PIN family [Spirochaetota bacterium]
MKVVLDTNALVSGMLNPAGKPGAILALVLEGELSVLHSPGILSEYHEVLHRPRFGFQSDMVATILGYIEEAGMPVYPLPANCSFPDEDDRVFYETALTGKAVALITGNTTHFPAGDPLIFTPPAFLEYWHRTRNKG